MKKLLAALLAVFMLVSVLTACSEEPKETKPSTPNNGIPDKNPDSNGDGEGNGNGTNPDKDPDGVDEIVFDDVNETVYVIEFLGGMVVEGLHLRNSLSFDSTSNIVHTVEPNTELTRIGFNESWSKVLYEGEEYYCSTRYLTTEKIDTSDVVFEDVTEDVYINTEEYGYNRANYYRVPLRDTNYLGGNIEHGTLVKRTGVYYEDPEDEEKLGWSRIVIGEDTFYIRNSLLSLTKPADAPTEE